NDSSGAGSAKIPTKLTNPANGQLTFNADGSFVYVPNQNFSGVDSFTYKINNGIIDSAPATVTINVTAVNDAPTVVPGGPYTVGVAQNLVLNGSGTTDPDDAQNTLTFACDSDYDGVSFQPDAAGISPNV